jgi:hypothetical protein
VRSLSLFGIAGIGAFLCVNGFPAFGGIVILLAVFSI